MKKSLLAIILFSTIQTYAQFNFSDDFESYSVGDYIAASEALWVVWPAAGAQDVQVIDSEASSGSNSIYLSSSAEGGGLKM